MSREASKGAPPVVDKQTQFAGDLDAALRPQAVPNFFPMAQKQSSLHGIGLMMIGASFLIVASTASVIAWTYFDATREKPAPQIAIAGQADLQALQRRVARLDELNRQLRSELDGLAGPGGVLPRVIEQLQVTKRTDAAQTGAIQQLMQDRLSAEVDTQETSNAVSNVDRQGLGPIQVTPVRSGSSEQPQMVIVTPQVPTEGQGQ